MSNYVLAFRGRPDRTPQPGEDQEWGAWFARLGSAIADFGNRVGSARHPAQPPEQRPGRARGSGAHRLHHRHGGRPGRRSAAGVRLPRPGA